MAWCLYDQDEYETTVKREAVRTEGGRYNVMGAVEPRRRDWWRVLLGRYNARIWIRSRRL